MSETINEVPLWDEQVKAFADAVGKTSAEIEEALGTVVGEKSQEALELLADPANTPDEDIKSAFAALKIPSAKLKAHLSKLRGIKVSEPSPVDTVKGISVDVLPNLGDDESFISALKIGGELKVGQTEVLAAVKAAIADRLGLYDLPEKIKKEMEKFAEEQEEPVGDVYFKLHKLVVERSYAEVLSVINVAGSFVTEGRKNQFLGKLNNNLWVSLHDFQENLKTWQTNWMSGAANPAVMMAAFLSGTGGNILPAGMMTPPETDSLRDSAETVVDTINKVFAGFGIPVARALAYDAIRIKRVLEEKDLPAMIGATTKEQMLKKLGIGIGADYPRLERNTTRFMLSIMEYKNISSGNEEYAYLVAMMQLGNMIPWDKFEGSGSGLGGRKNGQL